MHINNAVGFCSAERSVFIINQRNCIFLTGLYAGSSLEFDNNVTIGRFVRFIASDEHSAVCRKVRFSIVSACILDSPSRSAVGCSEVGSIDNDMIRSPIYDIQSCAVNTLGRQILCSVVKTIRYPFIERIMVILRIIVGRIRRSRSAGNGCLLARFRIDVIISDCLRRAAKLRRICSCSRYCSYLRRPSGKRIGITCILGLGRRFAGVNRCCTFLHSTALERCTIIVVEGDGICFRYLELIRVFAGQIKYTIVARYCRSGIGCQSCFYIVPTTLHSKCSCC